MPIAQGELVDNSSAELITLPSAALTVHRDPDVVLEEAAHAAKALKRVLEQKPKKVMMNDEQYLEFEDWQTVGRFYGITARIMEGSVRPVDFGSVQGFEATAEAITVVDGQTIILSRADAMCLNDEDKWRARPKYDYVYCLKGGGTSIEDPGADAIIWEDNPAKPGKKRPRKERKLVGEERVPLFQLRSMAQTRACAKALRNVLAWVVVLAGFRPTPAEELDAHAEHVDQHHAATPVATPQRRAEPPTTTQPPSATTTSPSSGSPSNALRVTKVDTLQGKAKVDQKTGVETPGKPFYVVQLSNGKKLSTFIDSVATAADALVTKAVTIKLLTEAEAATYAGEENTAALVYTPAPANTNYNPRLERVIA